jgi:hypothetical protein
LATLGLLGRGAVPQVTATLVNNRYVAPTGSDADNDCTDWSVPCRTVQRAVDVADAGDVVKVAQGTYTDLQEREGISQVVHLAKSVTLLGGYTTANGFAEPPDPDAHRTTLDAQAQGRVVVITGAGPTVEGFDITGGAGYYSGGGVMVEGGAGVILCHNRVFENSATGDGGGIFLNGGSAEIMGNLVFSNTSTWSAGMRIINNPVVSVVANEIRGNIAQNTGGGIDIDCCGGTTPLISQNLVIGNHSGAGGGGLRVSSTNARLVNNIVAGNEANGGDGVLLEGWKSYPVSVTLVHNTLAGQGGGDEGIRAEAWVDVDLVNNIIATFTTGVTNTAPTSSTVTADHNLFDGNGADYGDGVTSAHDVPGPAGFVSPATGDFHVTAESLAIDAGLDVEVRFDIDNQPRKGVPDIGADEYYPPIIVHLPLVLAHLSGGL